jgi:hypothetical protein
MNTPAEKNKDLIRGIVIGETIFIIVGMRNYTHSAEIRTR